LSVFAASCLFLSSDGLVSAAFCSYFSIKGPVDGLASSFTIGFSTGALTTIDGLISP